MGKRTNMLKKTTNILKKIINTLTEQITPMVGMSTCVLCLSIITLLAPQEHMGNWRFIISAVLIGIMVIVFFFQIRHRIKRQNPSKQ
jgi:hypothetical protein